MEGTDMFRQFSLDMTENPVWLTEKQSMYWNSVLIPFGTFLQKPLKFVTGCLPSFFSMPNLKAS